MGRSVDSEHPQRTHAEVEGLRCEFAANGFVVLPGELRTEEVEVLVAALDRLDRTATYNTRRRPRQPGDVLELRNCVARCQEFMDLVDRPAMLELLGALLGFNIQLGNSHCFIRPPAPPGTSVADQAGNGWHHDLVGTAVPVNGRLPHLATRVGWFLTPLSEPNSGSIFVVPGSHRASGRPAWDPATDRPFGALELRISDGAAVVFDNRLWHATAPNWSSRPRKNVYMEYCPRWVRPFDYRAYGDDVLAGASDLRRQLLGYDFSSIEDGDLGYQQPSPADVPLKGWMQDRGWEVPALRGD